MWPTWPARPLAPKRDIARRMFDVIPLASLPELARSTSGMVRIGKEVTETPDYKLGKLIKHHYIRIRLEETEEEQNIFIGQLPERPTPKGIAEPGLLADLFVAKYIDHLPFYRQTEMLKHDHGWAIHKLPINYWFAACCP